MSIIHLTIILSFLRCAVTIKRAITISPTYCQSLALYLPGSCQEVKQRMPESQSGMYRIAIDEDTAVDVYCHFETLCNSDEGWTRVAYINMTDPTENCPDAWRLYEDQLGIRGCTRPLSGPSCHSVIYPSYGIGYSEVCGRARGYQFGSTDAVETFVFGIAETNDINSYYVDGMSITAGMPREHIWTFMAGVKEDNTVFTGIYSCPCQTGSRQTTVPFFVGNDYYCESGNPVQPPGFLNGIIYPDDVLWDGEMCNGLESTCCTSQDLPWFHKILDMSKVDDIEVRICADQSTSDEDVIIELLEIYVK